MNPLYFHCRIKYFTRRYQQFCQWKGNFLLLLEQWKCYRQQHVNTNFGGMYFQFSSFELFFFFLYFFFLFYRLQSTRDSKAESNLWQQYQNLLLEKYWEKIWRLCTKTKTRNRSENNCVEQCQFYALTRETITWSNFTWHFQLIKIFNKSH